MSRSAAGRAGGRPATGGADRNRPIALLRAAVVVPLLAVPLLAGVPAAQASPPAQAAVPGILALPGDEETSDDTRPVRIDVGRLEPRTVTPGAVVTVAGTLTNTGTSTITDLSVRLQRGEVLTTRAELAAADRDPDPATTVTPDFQGLSESLGPGEEIEFSYAVPSADLGMDQDGVYPVLVNVNGAVDGDVQRRVGELSTFLVQQPVVPTERTAVAWLWPLVERPHRSASGGFRDDALTDAISSGGGSTVPSRCSSGCPAPFPRARPRRCPSCRSRSRSIPRWSRSSRSWPPAPTRSAASRTRATAPRRRRSSSTGCAPWPTSTTSSRSATATWTPTRSSPAA